MDVLRLNNGTTRTSSEIRSKLVKILERCPDVVLMSSLLTLLRFHNSF